MKENELRPVKSYEAKRLLMAAARGEVGADDIVAQMALEEQELRERVEALSAELEKVRGQLKAKDVKLRACRKELREME